MIWSLLLAVGFATMPPCTPKQGSVVIKLIDGFEKEEEFEFFFLSTVRVSTK